MLGVRLLGPLVVEGRTGPIVLTSRRQRAVLALLALQPGRPVSAERLSDWLWDQEPPPTAGKTLQTYLYRLRRALGPDLIESVPGGYALRLPAEAVDLLRFEAGVATGLRALEGGDPAAACAQLTEALAEWRGDPLPDASGSLAGDAAATRIRELHLAAQDGLAEARLRLGEHDLLVPGLEIAVSEAPLRERRWEQLARALAAAGRPADALRACGRARQVLVEAVGVEPGPGLRALEEQLLADTAGVGAVQPAAPGPSASIPAPLGDVVGRDAEAAALVDLLGRHRLVTVVGPGGAGKTTLVQRCREGIGPDHWFVDLDRLAAGAPVDQAVSVAVGAGELPGTDVGEAVVAVLRSRAGGARARLL